MRAYEVATLANEDGWGSFQHGPPKVAVGDADIVVSLDCQGSNSFKARA